MTLHSNFLLDSGPFELPRGEVDDSPILEKGVHSHDRTNISQQVLAAGRCCKMPFWIISPHCDDGVAIVAIHLLRLAEPTAAVSFVLKELWQCIPLNLMNSVYVEPCTADW